MSPKILLVLQVTFMLVCIAACFCGADDISKSTPKRKRQTNLTIMALACLGAFLVIFYYFKTPTTPAPYVEHNAAVLATVKEGDLVLCTNPATGQVTHALLAESSAPQGSRVIIHGNFLNKQSLFRTNGGIHTSYFDRCRVEIFRDDGLGSVDQKIGQIIRFGLNPPPPK